MKKVIIVLDCGATNIRAVAIDNMGQVLSQKSFSNNTLEDPYYKDGLIWDVEEIWGKLVEACRFVISEIKGVEIKGVCTTAFGVDGAPYNKNGQQLYPVISWACQRTKSVINEVHNTISLEKLYKISGVNNFHFNTLYKLYWLKKYHPEVIEEMDHWLFMPSIISNKLSGALYTDVSMLGTSMMGDLKKRAFSEEILSFLNISSHIFPKLKEAGQIVGIVQAEAARITGIPKGIPVISAGHDTQFAIFGSGAKINEAVLSSGTWEILMIRTQKINHNKLNIEAGITIELDAEYKILNPGIQWLGSGVLEWIKQKFYSVEKDQENIYDLMISEATEVGNTSDVNFYPNFLGQSGGIQGLGLQSSRGEIYLAALKALVQKTKSSLQVLEQLSGVKVHSLVVVGGGAKNQLWNKLRSQTLGIQIKTQTQTEATVMGAAMFAFTACGVYKTAEDAQNAFLKSASLKI